MSLLGILLLLLAALVGAVVLIALLLVLVPFALRAEGQIGEQVLVGSAELRWGGGVILLRASTDTGAVLYVAGRRVWRIRSDDQQEHEEAKPDEGKKEARGGVAGSRWALRHRRFLLRSGVRLVKALRLRAIAYGTIGLGDPAEAALLFALLDHAVGRLPGVQLALERDYLDETLEVTAALSASVWPIELAMLMAVQLIRADGRRALRDFFSTRKPRRQTWKRSRASSRA